MFVYVSRKHMLLHSYVQMFVSCLPQLLRETCLQNTVCKRGSRILIDEVSISACGGFQKSGVVTYTSMSRALITRTPTKRTAIHRYSQLYTYDFLRFRIFSYLAVVSHFGQFRIFLVPELLWGGGSARCSNQACRWRTQF